MRFRSYFTDRNMIGVFESNFLLAIINYFFLLPRSKVRSFGTNFTAESLTFMHWSSYMRAIYNSGSKNVNNLKRQNLSALC